MEARHVGVGQHVFREVGAAAGDEVDHARGQPRFLQKLHEVVVGEHRRGGRFPEHGVAEERRRRTQVAADRGEVEGRNRHDEAVEGAVFHAVPHGGGGRRLLLHDLLRVVDVEAEEVRKLAGGVDLGLIAGLALAQHGGGVDFIAPGPGEQVRGLQEDRRPVLPGHPGPGGLRRAGGLDGGLQLGLAGAVVCGEDMAVVVGHRDRAEHIGLDLRAADHQRDLDLLGRLAAQLRLQGGAFAASGQVSLHGLVLGLFHEEECVAH